MDDVADPAPPLGVDRVVSRVGRRSGGVAGVCVGKTAALVDLTCLSVCRFPVAIRSHSSTLQVSTI